jgi:hypothetical protein
MGMRGGNRAVGMENIYIGTNSGRKRVVLWMELRVLDVRTGFRELFSVLSDKGEWMSRLSIDKINGRDQRRCALKLSLPSPRTAQNMKL